MIFGGSAHAQQSIEGKVIGFWNNRGVETAAPEQIKVYPEDLDNGNDLVNINIFAREMLKRHPQVYHIQLLINGKYIVSWKQEDGKWYVKGVGSPRYFPVNLRGEL